MQIFLNVLQILGFILVLLSIPSVIFFPARKVTEWIVGLLLLFILILYYSYSIIYFFESHRFINGFTEFIINFLTGYRDLIFGHLPYLDGIPIFGFKFLSIKVDYSFDATLWPTVILWVGGLVRLVVVKFVPENRLRQLTQEYWLYTTSFLMLLLILSNIFEWNFLTTFIIFLFILLIIATGIYQIIKDVMVLTIEIFRHILKWVVAGIRRIWLGMRYVALFAVKVAKFINNIFSNIRMLYDKYIRGPFRWLHRKLIYLEEKEAKSAEIGKQNVTIKLEQEKLEEKAYNVFNEHNIWQ